MHNSNFELYQSITQKFKYSMEIMIPNWHLEKIRSFKCSNETITCEMFSQAATEKSVL